MGSVTVYDAVRMKQIEDETIVAGEVDAGGNLILTTREGTEFDAGHVRGENATALLSIQDTSTIDLSLAGSGTPADPWVLSGVLKNLPAGAVVTGLLEATYRGGKAKVKIAGTLSTEEFSWLAPYQPQKSRVVRLLKVGSTWFITGQDEDDDRPLTINRSIMSTYAEMINTMIFAREPRVTKLPSGLVMLGGLLRSTAAVTNGTTIAYLPEGFRPENQVIFNVEFGDSGAGVTIMPNGDIVARAGWSSSNYVSLDGIAFWAAGVAQWTDIGSGGSSWGAGFSSNPGYNTLHGTPGFWKDPYGFVWFRGLVVHTAAQSVDNTPMVILPDGYRSYKQQHNRTVGNEIFSFIGSRPVSGSGLDWKSGSPATNGTWHSLYPCILTTADARNNNPWKAVTWWNNSWNNYGVTQFPGAGYLLREDGLRISEGLISAGTIGNRPFILHEEEYWPSTGRKILSAVSGALRGRWDIYGTEANDSDMGTVTPTQGTNAWFSIDSKVWYP